MRPTHLFPAGVCPNVDDIDVAKAEIRSITRIENVHRNLIGVTNFAGLNTRKSGVGEKNDRPGYFEPKPPCLPLFSLIFSGVFVIYFALQHRYARGWFYVCM